MLTPRGHVKIIDFGLAKLAQHRLDHVLSDLSTDVLTQPGMIMGTVRYMSPEQALGREVDHRTDIFSLGAVLYEMATGQPPFRGASATETIDRILHSQPEVIRGKSSSTQWELEIIIRKCMEKQPERRYQLAEELVEDLRALKQQCDSQANLLTKARFGLHRYRRLLLLAALACLLVAAIVAAWNWAAPFLRNQPVDSLAVLPLDSGGNPNLEYIADGVAESIINDVSRASELRVIARASVFRYKGRHADPSVVGRDLHVRAVLTGRVTQKDDLLLFSLELSDTRDGRHIWGRRYDRKVASLPAFQKELAQEISQTLQPGRPGSATKSLLKEPTKNPEAYRLFLLARYHAGRMTQEGLKKGVELYEQATRLDAAYAPPFLGIARAYHYASGWYFPQRGDAESPASCYPSFADRREPLGRACGRGNHPGVVRLGF
jgi:non-specific serine/threonine protein kinase